MILATCQCHSLLSWAQFTVVYFGKMFWIFLKGAKDKVKEAPKLLVPHIMIKSERGTLQWFICCWLAMPWSMAATLALGVLSSGLHTLVLHLHHKHHHHHQNALFKTNLIVAQQTIWLWLSSWLLLEQRSVQFCCFLLEMSLLLLFLTGWSGKGLDVVNR